MSILTKLAARFCATPLPDSVCVDRVANRPMPGRAGTNLMTVAEAEQVLLPVALLASEAAFRAGFAAAEEALGAHGSERLLNATEEAWADYAADNALPAEFGNIIADGMQS